MKIAIVDDEKKWQSMAKKEIQKCYDEDVLIDCFSTGEEFLKREEEYQVVFMDIEMPGKDGFVVSGKYKNQFPNALIIIMTTHTELSRLGYRINAFRYIDKLHMEEIEEALQSAEKVLRRYKKITLKVRGIGEQEVCCKDVLYFEAANHNVKVKMNQDMLECQESIGKLEELLSEFGFYLVHRAYLVNFDSIREFKKGSIVLYNDEKIPVSRKKYQDLKEKHFQWKFENANA